MEKSLLQTLTDYALRTGYEDIPPKVIAVQKTSIADMLAVMLAATADKGTTDGFSRYISQMGSGRCTLLTHPTKTSPVMAALGNGALVHALDFEDSHETATVHPNSAAFPALMALSEHVGHISGKQFLAAAIVASDICCRLDLGVNEDLLKYGWNMPPVHGSMAAVFGACNLLKLSRSQTADAIAINLSHTCSGEAANSRSSALRIIREGFAAQSAVQSTLLAQSGVPAALEQPFEGAYGYFHMYARGNYTREKITEGLGKRFESSFISFKPWPTCRATHTSIEAVMNIMKSQRLKAEDITAIHVVMQEIGRMVIEPKEAKYRPSTAAIAKFSLPFVLASTAIYGNISLDSFTAEKLSDPALLSFADKVTVSIDNSLSKEQNKITNVTVSTKSNQYHKYLEHPLGCVEHPMSEAHLWQKFSDCCTASGRGYTKEQMQQLYDTISNLEQLSDVSELFQLISFVLKEVRI